MENSKRITVPVEIALLFVSALSAFLVSACSMESIAEMSAPSDYWEAEDDTSNDQTDEDESDEVADCDTENEVVLFLSADDSNSMAGPVIARALINNGFEVYSSIRTYEFLNYYTFNYDAPEMGSLRVDAEIRPSVDETAFDLQIGVRSWDVDAQNRRPVNLTLSLDTSGSMGGLSIDLVRESCRAIAGSLKEGDVISMVTWDTSQNILLDSWIVDGPDDPHLLDECLALDAGGSTDLNSGLVTAYELARKNFSPDRINRVILMSDGGANVGVTEEDLIAEHADDADGESIYLMGVGVGDGSYYNDVLMDTVTDAGKGAYIFVDSKEEARKMFKERFLSNIEVAARNVQVALTLPPTFSMVEFHGEEYSANPEEVEPQHLAPNDAMIFHQQIASCEPSAVSMSDAIQVTANFSYPITGEEKSCSMSGTLGELLAADAPLLLKGNAVVEYAEALKELKTLSGADAQARIDQALQKVTNAKTALANDPDLIEIEDLLKAYRSHFH